MTDVYLYDKLITTTTTTAITAAAATTTTAMFGFYLTGLFSTVHSRLDQRPFVDFWCNISDKLDALSVTQPTVSKQHWRKIN